MEKEKIVARFEKNSKEEVRAVLTEFRGHRVADLRIYFRPDKGGEMIPSKKGLSLTLDLLPELKQAVLALEEAVKGSKS